MPWPESNYPPEAESHWWDVLVALAFTAATIVVPLGIILAAWLAYDHIPRGLSRLVAWAALMFIGFVWGRRYERVNPKVQKKSIEREATSPTAESPVGGVSPADAEYIAEKGMEAYLRQTTPAEKEER